MSCKGAKNTPQIFDFRTLAPLSTDLLTTSNDHESESEAGHEPHKQSCKLNERAHEFAFVVS